MVKPGVWAPGLRYHNGTFYLTSTTRYVYTCAFPENFHPDCLALLV